MVWASSPADVRRLKRAGGEVWQEYFQGVAGGGARWRRSLVKVPVAAAIRLQLVTPGAELRERADVVEAPQGKRRNANRVTQPQPLEVP